MHPMFGWFKREGGRSKYDKKSLENEQNPAPIEGVEASNPDEEITIPEDEVPTEIPAPERVHRPTIVGTENTENPLPLDMEAATAEAMKAYEEAATIPEKTTAAMIGMAETGGANVKEYMQGENEAMSTDGVEIGTREASQEVEVQLDIEKKKYQEKLENGANISELIKQAGYLLEDAQDALQDEIDAMEEDRTAYEQKVAKAKADAEAKGETYKEDAIPFEGSISSLTKNRVALYEGLKTWLESGAATEDAATVKDGDKKVA